MSPRRPSHIDLGPHRIHIEWLKERWPVDPTDDTDQAELISGGFRVGEAHFLDNTIKVATDQAPTQQAGTLLHEFLHHAFHQTPIASMAGWNEETEEAIVQALEDRLLELFTRNPTAVAWLAAGGRTA